MRTSCTPSGVKMSTVHTAPMTPAADDGTVAAGGRLIGGMSFDAFTVDLGWRPGFIMIKATADATGDSNNWRYWSERKITSLQFVTGTLLPVRNADTTLTVSDTGFSADLQNDASYIYWCSRDLISDPSSLPTISVTDVNGNFQPMSDASVTEYLNAADTETSRAALITGFNGITTNGVNWTATADSTDTQLSLVSDVYSSDAGNDNLNFTSPQGIASVRDEVSETTTTVIDGGHNSGFSGGIQFVVDLGTEENLTTTVSTVMGDGSFTQLISSEGFPNTVGTASIYTVASPQNDRTMQITSSVSDVSQSDLPTVLSEVVTFVNNSVDPEVPVNFDVDLSNTTLTFTGMTRGIAEGEWTITTDNRGQLDNPGNINFSATIITTEGIDDVPINRTVPTSGTITLSDFYSTTADATRR